MLWVKEQRSQIAFKDLIDRQKIIEKRVQPNTKIGLVGLYRYVTYLQKTYSSQITDYKKL